MLVQFLSPFSWEVPISSNDDLMSRSCFTAIFYGPTARMTVTSDLLDRGPRIRKNILFNTSYEPNNRFRLLRRL